MLFLIISDSTNLNVNGRPKETYTLLTKHLITVNRSIHINLIDLVVWLFLRYFLDVIPTSSMKWRQRPNMTIAVEWDVKHQFKTNKQVDNS